MTTNPIAPPSSGFDAGEGGLTYDFTKFVEGAKGEIPEPSSNQIETFIEFLRQVMPIKEDEQGKPVLDVAAIVARFDGQDSAEIEALLNKAVSEVCSGSPSAEQIAALPYRPKQRFYGWLLGSLLSPEA